MDIKFDWVKARAACTLGQVLKELELGAKADIDVMKAVAPDRTFKVSSDGRFSVFETTGTTEIKAVDFEIRNGLIHVSQNGKTLLEASLTLDNQGQCKLKVRATGEELDQWQIRKIALEDLLFGNSK